MYRIIPLPHLVDFFPIWPLASCALFFRFISYRKLNIARMNDSTTHIYFILSCATKNQDFCRAASVVQLISYIQFRNICCLFFI